MILSIDVGTSFLKFALFELESRDLLESGQFPLHPLGREDNRWESDPQEWIEALKTIFSSLSSRGQKRELKSIVIAANGPSLVMVGRDHRPLQDGILWMDSRDREWAERIEKGTPSSFHLSRMVYFSRENPQLYEKTLSFFTIEGYLNYLLSGTSQTILPSEEFTPLYWREDVAEKFHLDREKLPPFALTGDFIGQTRRTPLFPELPEGVDLFAGGPDYTLALLGVEATKPGRVCDRTGSSEAINLCLAKKADSTNLMSYQHVISPYYNIAGMLNNSGSAIRWFKELTDFRNLSYEEFFTRVLKKSRAGGNRLLFLPYLTGERYPLWDAEAKGAFIGLKANHTLEDMGEAVLEATLYSVCGVLEELERYIPIEELRLTGNLSSHHGFNQLRADICQKEVWISDLGHAELRGGLAIALFGLKIFPTLSESAAACVCFREKISPRRENQPLFEEMFHLFKEGYPTMQRLFHSL